MTNIPNIWKKHSLNKLLNNFESEKDRGVDIRDKNLPGIPQWDKYDCLIPLIILAISNGEVLIISKAGIFSFFSRCGTSSFAF